MKLPHARELAAPSWGEYPEAAAAYELEAFYEQHDSKRGVLPELDSGRRLFADYERHLFQTLKAAEQLGELPGPGQTLHGVMRGDFNAWDLTPAIAGKIAPATIRRLDVATLGFNAKNATELGDMLDAGQLERCDFICSSYFHNESNGGDTFNQLRETLRGRGRLLAMRNHAKLQMIETTAGEHYCLEGSANLRSCRAIEQFTLTHSRELVEFHRVWMDECFEQIGGGKFAAYRDRMEA